MFSNPGRSIMNPRGSNFFPQTLGTKCHMQLNQSLNAGSAFVNSFKGNSFYLAGPSPAYGSAFVANVPSGLYYLLSSSAAAGAVAPYQEYRIKSSSIILTVASNQAQSSIPVYIFVIPSTKSTLAGMAISQLEEQPFCKRYLMPGGSSNPRVIRHSMSSSKIWGDPRYQIAESEYEGTAAANPNKVWFWHLEFRSANGSTNMDIYYDFKINYNVDFFNLNQLVTSVPS